MKARVFATPPTPSQRIFMSLLARSLILLPLLLGSCQAVYYSTLERFGVDKRDIMVDRTAELGESLNRLAEKVDGMAAIYAETIHMEGGDLVLAHKNFSRACAQSESAARAFHTRIEDLHEVAQLYFDEWKERSGEIIDPELRRSSLGNYGMVQRNYAELVRTMRAVESELDPTLTRFNDHVVYLKLNLHRNTLASLQEEEEEMQGFVEKARTQLQTAIIETRDFAELVDY